MAGFVKSELKPRILGDSNVLEIVINFIKIKDFKTIRAAVTPQRSLETYGTIIIDVY